MIKRIPVLTWFAILVVVTIVLGLVIPPSTATLNNLHVTIAVYRELILAVLVTYALIWFTAFYAYDKLTQYSRELKQTPEESAFSTLSWGIGVLAWGLAISTILSSVLLGLSDRYQSLTAARTIITNYSQLLFALVGFSFIGNGIHKLAVLVNAGGTLRAVRIIFGVLALIGTFFTYFALRTRFTMGNPYHLSPPLLVATIVAPYLYTWFVGLVAAYELWLYARAIKGVIYRQSLNLLGYGLGIVIVSSITDQYITCSVGGNTKLGVGAILLIIYGLFAVMAAGYILVALGAKRLKKIEEV